MSVSNQVMNKPVANLSIVEENVFRVLQETLYPGSSDAEVRMILSYCQARRLDPVLKPVHLVPMSVKSGKKDEKGKDIYERKNVIMPGIGMYRIDASRSGQYAGMGEPEFGEEVTETFGKDDNRVKVTFPKWCKIKVKKLLSNGEIVEFTAKEYWKENFATKSKWDESPNDIWIKRCYGQLAKCTEAQALRKAFPDVVGNEYTKEEMEGKLHHHDEQRPTQNKTKTYEAKAEPVNQADEEVITPHDIEQDVMDIGWADSIDNLQSIFTLSYKYWIKIRHTENVEKIIKAKNKRKTELETETKTDEVNVETGEIQ